MVVDKYEKQHATYVKIKNTMGKDDYRIDKEQWKLVTVGGNITLKFGEDGACYVKAINDYRAHEQLTGAVTDKIQENGVNLAVIQFDQIGEETIIVEDSNWANYDVGQRVRFSTKENGSPAERLD